MGTKGGSISLEDEREGGKIDFDVIIEMTEKMSIEDVESRFTPKDGIVDEWITSVDVVIKRTGIGIME